MRQVVTDMSQSSVTCFQLTFILFAVACLAKLSCICRVGREQSCRGVYASGFKSLFQITAIILTTCSVHPERAQGPAEIMRRPSDTASAKCRGQSCTVRVYVFHPQRGQSVFSLSNFCFSSEVMSDVEWRCSFGTKSVCCKGLNTDRDRQRFSIRLPNVSCQI